jgi:hypothetical protein
MFLIHISDPCTPEKLRLSAEAPLAHLLRQSWLLRDAKSACSTKNWLGKNLAAVG